MIFRIELQISFAYIPAGYSLLRTKEKAYFDPIGYIKQGRIRLIQLASSRLLRSRYRDNVEWLADPR